jgi:hypothetical protein
VLVELVKRKAAVLRAADRPPRSADPDLRILSHLEVFLVCGGRLFDVATEDLHDPGDIVWINSVITEKSLSRVAVDLTEPPAVLIAGTAARHGRIERADRLAPHRRDRGLR